MRLRDHPALMGRWPPKQAPSGAYASTGPRPIRPPLAETAVLHRVVDCPPFPPGTGAHGVMLYTDHGSAVITTTDALFREQVYHTLHASLGLSLREIGDLEIDF
jgi:hypothetical protein